MFRGLAHSVGRQPLFFSAEAKDTAPGSRHSVSSRAKPFFLDFSSFYD